MSVFMVSPKWVWVGPVYGCGWRLRSGAGALGDLGEELVVARRGPDLVHETLQVGGVRAVAGQGVEHPAQLPDLLELAPLEEELLVARRAGVDVDGRVQAALRETPVEPQLHVARALEL